MDMLNRYLSAVAKQAPIDERVRIVKLTRSTIEARLAKDLREIPTEEKLVQALLDLGPPTQVVNRFITVPRYIIGPSVYDAYWQILTLVFWTILLTLTIATGADFIFNSTTNGFQLCFVYLTNILSALAQAFLWITLVFIVFERQGIRIPLKRDWHPNQLPPASKLGGEIHRLEPLIGLAVTAIFFTLFYFVPQIIGLYYFEGQAWHIISIFNLENLPQFLPFFLLLFATSSARELAKLMSGQWNYPVLFVVIICNIATVITTAMLVFESELWNPNFVAEFQLIFNTPAPLLIDWRILQQIIVVVLALILIADSVLNAIRVWSLHKTAAFLDNEKL